LEVVKEQIASLDRRAGGSAEKLQKLSGQHKSIEAEIVKREVELYQFRTEMDPDNAEAFFELGHRLRRLGRIDDAIRALQKARSDPRHQWEALLWLGVAFWQKKNYSLADKNLADALDALPPNDETAKKKVLYYRGCVAQEQGNTDDAIGYFNDIAAIDYGYKDVAKRLDELNET
jgi:tetratricopeptide (TPR) repeat protein